MTNPWHIMIDIETIATDPGAAVLSIGAIKFRTTGPDKMEVSSDRFYKRLEIAPQLGRGRTSNPDTLAWWKKQDPKVRAEAFEYQRTLPAPAMVDLNIWLANAKYDGLVWANSPQFDLVILESLMEDFGLKLNIPFRKYACVRTARAVVDALGYGLAPSSPMLFDGEGAPKYPQHHPLGDCLYQAYAVCKMYELLAQVQPLKKALKGTLKKALKETS